MFVNPQGGKQQLTLAFLVDDGWRAFSLPPGMDEEEAVQVQGWILERLKGLVQLPQPSTTKSTWRAPAMLQEAVNKHENLQERLLALMGAFRMWVKSLGGNSSAYPGVFWVCCASTLVCAAFTPFVSGHL